MTTNDHQSAPVDDGRLTPTGPPEATRRALSDLADTQTVLHEAGHIVLVHALGGHVDDVVFGSRDSWVDAWLPQAGPAAVPAAVMVLIAGQLATGSRTGCCADRAEIRDGLHGLAWPLRRRIRRFAHQQTARVLRVRRHELARVADHLTRTGRAPDRAALPDHRLLRVLPDVLPARGPLAPTGDGQFGDEPSALDPRDAR